MLLAIAIFGFVIVFRLVQNKIKRALEVIGAILALVLVMTSAYLSPALGDRIEVLKHAPRNITPKQKDAFMKALKDAPRGSVLIKTNSLDNETAFYMSQLRALLDEAGYSGDVVTEMGHRIMSPNSLTLVIKDKEHTPDYAGEIQKAFKAMGDPANGYIPEGEIPWLKSGDVVVFVSPKR